MIIIKFGDVGRRASA